MHIIIGIISALAGLIWALNALQRSGFNPQSLNPFLWNRRRQWKKLYAEKPIYNLNKPIEVAGLLLLGTVKCEGEISSEQKKQIKQIFIETFEISESEAAELFLSSSHLIKDELYLVDNIDKVLEKSHDQFTSEQKTLLISLMKQVSTIEGSCSTEQQKLISATSAYLSENSGKKGQW